MRIKEVLERFEIESPISVMARLTLDHLLDKSRLDDLFRRHAVQQKCGELLFSTIADLMALVAMKAKPSVHAAYRYRTSEINDEINVINAMRVPETDVLPPMPPRARSWRGDSNP